MRAFLYKAGKIAAMVAIIAAPFSAQAGINDIFKGWSWTPNFGWISMNSTNTNAAVSYGVTVDDDSNVYGYAWSQNAGWICFGMTCPGTAPDGSTSWAELDKDLDNLTPQLYGWARVYALYTANPSGQEGWISLNCKNSTGHPARDICSTVNYQVSTTRNGGATDGQFLGYAWGCTSPTGGACTSANYNGGIGWIRFDPLYAEPIGTYGSVPWIQVLYGDLYAKGNISTPSPFVTTFKQVNAWYCIDTAGTVTHFQGDITKCASGTLPLNINLPKKGTNYSNVLGRIKLRGYSSALVPDVSALSTGKYGAWQQLNDPSLLPAVLGGGVYDTVNDQAAGGPDWTLSGRTISNAGVSGNGSGLLIVRGNLHITGDIVYDNTPINDLKRLASFGILVLADNNGHQGDVIIDPGVTTISANVYAEGKISTGSTFDPTTEQRLVINGVAVAKQFNFQRVYSGASNEPSEQFINDGRIVVNTPPGMNDFVASLPSISY